MPTDLSYREIWLSKGQIALVDECDFNVLSQWKWSAQWNTFTKTYYAARTVRSQDGKSTSLMMHRFIMGLAIGDPILVDHIEPSGTLDNRRSNLRLATHKQNIWNARTPVRNTSGFKGVSARRGRWRARLKVNGKDKQIGTFSSREEAFSAYCYAVKQHRGEFGRTA